MKRTLAFFALAAVAAHGAIPTTAEGWYTPATFKHQSSAGYMYYYDDDGLWQHADITVDEDGNYSGEVDIDVFGAAYPAFEALVKALKAETLAQRNTERIEEIGKNLNNLKLFDGITIRPEGAPSGSSLEYKITFDGGLASAMEDGKTPSATSSADWADKKSLTWSGEDGKLELSGWKDRDTSGSLWDALSTCVGIPVRTAYGGVDVEYMDWWGIDRQSLMPNATSQKLEIRGWAAGSPNSGTASLGDVLSGKAQATSYYGGYRVLMRPTNGGNPLYMSIGTVKAGGLDVPVDGVTIVTNSATKEGQLQIAGFWEASTGDSGYVIPYGLSGSLNWGGLLDLMNGSLFEQDEEGMVQLAGFDEAAGGATFFGMDVNGSVGWQTPIEISDQVSLDENADGFMQLRGFEDGTDEGTTLADLALGTAQARAPYSLVTRCEGSDGPFVTYLPIGDDFGREYEGDDDTITSEDSEEENVRVFSVPVGRFVESVTGSGPISATDDGAGNVTLSFTGAIDGSGNLFPDGVSIETVANGSSTNIQIKGWAEQESCGANLHDMLTDVSNGDRATHEILCRVDGALHYLPLGSDVIPTPDETTITEDATTHKLKVKPGTAGKFLKSGSSDVEWADLPVKSVTGDSMITATTSSGDVSLSFAGYTGENGVSVSGDTISGAYTGENGVSVSGGTISGAYTGSGGISVSGGTISYTDDAELVSITFITSVEWNQSTKQLIAHSMTLPVKVQKNFATTPNPPTVIFTATSHADEHAGEDDN